MWARYVSGCSLLTAVLLAWGCGKTDTDSPTAPATLPVEPAPLGELMGGDYIPPDALFVSVLFPNRLLSRPEWADAPIEEVFQKINLSGGFPDMPLLPISFLSAAGIRTHDVKHVVHVVTGIRRIKPPVDARTEDAGGPAEGEAEETRDGGDTELNAVASYDVEQDPFSYGFLIDAYVVRLTRPVPRDAAVAVMFRPKEIAFAGETYYGQGRDTGVYALHFVDEKTMIVGEERAVRAMLAEKKMVSPLTEALNKLDLEQDVHCVLHVPAARQHLPLGELPIPNTVEDVSWWKALTEDTATATLSIRLDSRPSARLALIGNDARAGGRIAEAVVGVLGTVREAIKASPHFEHPDPKVQETLSIFHGLADRVVNGFEVTRVEARVELSVDDLAETAKLVTLSRRINDTALGDIKLPPPGVVTIEEDSAASIIRRLIPAAAGIPYDIMAVLVQSETTPKTSELFDKSLTVLSLVYQIPPPGFYKAHEEEFSYDGEHGAANAADQIRELARSRHLGYVSMIQPERITGFTCNVDGETAEGTVSFEVPDLYRGKTEYVAQRVDGRWQINEFRLPVHKWRFVRQDDGCWKWLDPYGNMDDRDRMPGHPVLGKVTYERKPVDAFLIFYRTPDPILPGGEGRPASGGEYFTELVPGTYHVVVRSREVDVPGKYGAPDTTDLKIEVKEGRNEFNFDLQPD